jgi:hypothetical protein
MLEQQNKKETRKIVQDEAFKRKLTYTTIQVHLAKSEN